MNSMNSPALTGIRVDGELNDFMASVTVTQHYVNTGKEAIEAIYTFPLPVDAVLLDAHFLINGKKLEGVIASAERAEAKYEDAIAEGNTAVLLENTASGIYTVSAGNIHPGEEASIEYRFGQLHRWNGDELRFHLPTVIADRYGDPASGGFKPHAVPHSDLQADYDFNLSLRVTGKLAEARFECPSHKMKFERNEAGALISASGQMDRDFIVNIRGGFENEEQLDVQSIQDGDGAVVAVRLRPIGKAHDIPPRVVDILVDCSGSMGGDSIQQARDALLTILDKLRPCDQFNITRFGSRSEAFFGERIPATTANIEKAKNRVREMDADMGGTELGSALEAVFESGMAEGNSHSILLITDGEVMDCAGLTNMVRGKACRIFSVGVGSAVAENVVRELAETSGGACELVSPKENMKEHIVRHFERIDMGRWDANIAWPGKTEWLAPERMRHFYDGDTVYLFARYKGKLPTQTFRMSATREDQKREWNAAMPVPIVSEDRPALARIAAAHYIKCLKDQKKVESIAVKYQLMSEWTSWVVVDERASGEKAEGLPVTQSVPQMPAAGWGGMGTVLVSNYCMASPKLDVPAFQRKSRSVRKTCDAAMPQSIFEDLEIPTFIRMGSSAEDQEACQEPSVKPDVQLEANVLHSDAFQQFISRLVSESSVDIESRHPMKLIIDLEDMGLPGSLAEWLKSLCGTFGDEQIIVVAFLNTLVEMGVFSSGAKRLKLELLIQRAWNKLADRVKFDIATEMNRLKSL